MKKRKPHILPTAVYLATGLLVHMLTTTHAAQPAEAYADFTEDGRAYSRIKMNICSI